MSRDPDLLMARHRLRVVVGLFVAALAILGLRLGDLALMSADAAGALRPVAGAPSSARRADIVDRHGNLVATDYPKTSLFGDPAEINDPHATVSALAL